MVPSALEESAARKTRTIVEQSDLDLRLRRGEVVVDLEEKNERFVVGRIRIDQPPAAVWPVLVNPFEFQGTICPRMKSVDVLFDSEELSVLKCSINVCFLIPNITYVVESHYVPVQEVRFRRVGGNLKDFRGSWLLRPLSDGKSTEVLYAMFIDPGIPIPKWLVREALKVDLPKTLTGLRSRVECVYGAGAPLSAKTLKAALTAGKAIPVASRKGSI